MADVIKRHMPLEPGGQDRDPPVAQIEQAILRWRSLETVAIIKKHSSTNTTVELCDGQTTLYLRLMPLAWRNTSDAEAELAFVRHQSQAGCKVALPLQSRSGAYVEAFDRWCAVMFQSAPGHHPLPKGPGWCMEMFVAWGSSLALQHQACLSFDHTNSSWRQDWRLDPALLRGLSALERLDPATFAKASVLLDTVEQHSETFGTVGVVHADLAPQNFRWSVSGGLTAFDFDNCCRHWLLYDLEVARSFVAKFEKADKLMSWILSGYQSVATLPGDMNHIHLLSQLRLLYVLCDRISLISSNLIDAMPHHVEHLRDVFVGAVEIDE